MGLLVNYLARVIAPLWHRIDPDERIARGVDARTGTIDRWTVVLIGLVVVGLVLFVVMWAIA